MPFSYFTMSEKYFLIRCTADFVIPGLSCRPDPDSERNSDVYFRLRRNKQNYFKNEKKMNRDETSLICLEAGAVQEE